MCFPPKVEKDQYGIKKQLPFGFGSDRGIDMAYIGDDYGHNNKGVDCDDDDDDEEEECVEGALTGHSHMVPPPAVRDLIKQ